MAENAPLDVDDEENVALIESPRRDIRKATRHRISCNPQRWMMVIFAAVTSIVFVFALSLSIGLGLSRKSPPFSATYQHAAVATDAAPCSEIGADILKRGGSAVDAAIAATLCVGVVNIHSTGIGGGGFMVYYNSSSKESYALDFRERAPLNGSKFMYNDTAPDASTHGKLKYYSPYLAPPICL